MIPTDSEQGGGRAARPGPAQAVHGPHAVESAARPERRRGRLDFGRRRPPHRRQPEPDVKVPKDFAEMADIEFVIIDVDTKLRVFKNELRYNDVAFGGR